MYKIHADNTLIYDSTLEDYKIGKGTVSLEVDKSGSFVFSVYPDHFFYDSFIKLKTLITVHRSNKILFRGRILNDVTDYWNNKAITCEGELGFFNDSIIRPFTFRGTEAELFRKFIDEHNAGVDDFKRFKIGVVTVSDNIVEYSNKNYDSTFKNMTTCLTRGHFVITHGEDGTDPIPTINYLSEFTKVASQKIEFGSNLKKYTKTVKAENIATAIIPIATVDGETITIDTVNNGVDYIYSEEAVALYGWVFKVVSFEDITNASSLKTKAEEYIKDVVNQNITVDLNAIDLHLLDKSVESFNIGDYIHVTSEPHNFDATLLCNKQTIDLLKPENDSLVLGYLPSTLTGTNSQVTTKIEKVEGEIEHVETEIENLKDNTGGDGDNRYFEIKEITESSAQIGLYDFAEGDDVRIFLRLNNEVNGLYDNYHTIDFNSMSDGVFDVNFTGLPSDTDFAVNVKYGDKWLGAQTFKTRGGSRSFEIETITENSGSIALYNFVEGDEVRVFLRLNHEVEGLYDNYHTITAQNVIDNKCTINFTGLPPDTDFAVNVKYGENWLGAQTFKTRGGRPCFEIEEITESSAKIALYNFAEDDEARVFLRLNNKVEGLYDRVHTLDANKNTITFTGLPSDTDFAVNIKHNDNWIGAQTFKTLGDSRCFDIIEITDTSVTIQLLNFVENDVARIVLRYNGQSYYIQDNNLTITAKHIEDNSCTMRFRGLPSDTAFTIDVGYNNTWIGAQTFRTTGETGNRPYFELTEISDDSAVVTLYNVPIGDEVRIFVRLPDSTEGIDIYKDVTESPFEIGLSNIPSGTDFVVNIKYGDTWIGAQTFRTKGKILSPYFELTDIYDDSAVVTLYNVPVGEEIRIFIRRPDETDGIDLYRNVTGSPFDIGLTGIPPSTDFVINIKYGGEWLGAQTFRTKSS